jgi:hypothetical protein
MSPGAEATSSFTRPWSVHPFNWRKPVDDRRANPDRVHPDGVERVEPSGAVLPMSDPRELDRTEGMRIDDIDANL